ncbi:hypothetical protein WN48_08761 [Eufriesea mexicana]|nr:hypothetical protein WN48_08761 [Eufriesea mexicana]
MAMSCRTWRWSVLLGNTFRKYRLIVYPYVTWRATVRTGRAREIEIAISPRRMLRDF